MLGQCPEQGGTKSGRFGNTEAYIGPILKLHNFGPKITCRKVEEVNYLNFNVFLISTFFLLKKKPLWIQPRLLMEAFLILFPGPSYPCFQEFFYANKSGIYHVLQVHAVLFWFVFIRIWNIVLLYFCVDTYMWVYFLYCITFLWISIDLN